MVGIIKAHKSPPLTEQNPQGKGMITSPDLDGAVPRLSVHQTLACRLAVQNYALEGVRKGIEGFR